MSDIQHPYKQISILCAGKCQCMTEHFIRKDWTKRKKINDGYETRLVYKDYSMPQIDHEGIQIGTKKRTRSFQETFPKNEREIDTEFQIVECCECGFISYRVCQFDPMIKDIILIPNGNFKTVTKLLSDGTEDYDEEEDFDELEVEREIEISIYPDRGEHLWKQKVFKNLNENHRNVEAIYSQVIKAYNNDLMLLCVTGLRTLVEIICKSKGIKGIEFTSKKGKKVLKDDIEGLIDSLAQQNLLSEADAKWLHVHRILGNKAVHEGKTPPLGHIQTIIRIIEKVMSELFEPKLPDEMEEIKKGYALVESYLLKEGYPIKVKNE
jgi:Domain of unknown function (DUF4145)